MQCNKPVRIYNTVPEGIEVPCGKCIACRIKKKSEWALRMLHELDSHQASQFITLTYDEDHVPKNLSLKK